MAVKTGADKPLDTATRLDAASLDEALAGLDARELRELVHTILSRLDRRTRGNVVATIIGRAVRGAAEEAATRPAGVVVSEIVAFADAARRLGSADPHIVDLYLQRGSAAFLAADYAVALQIYEALLLPVGDFEINLGEEDQVQEVLDVDLATCATQYVVATYMTTDSELRAAAVQRAIDHVHMLGSYLHPIEEMEGAAVEPLPGLDDFLPRWLDLVQETAGKSIAEQDPTRWSKHYDGWLREIVHRMGGAEEIASFARATRLDVDLHSWCCALVDTRDWDAALGAFEEAAATVTDALWSRGDFLDGAALAAQELGRGDLPARLERAWRREPSMLRLRRWLGSSGDEADLRQRAAAALEACPEGDTRQRALLHVVLGDLEPAAGLLAAAPGKRWTSEKHPGYLLFPLFCRFLGPLAPGLAQDIGPLASLAIDDSEHGRFSSDPDAPQLANPTVDEILAIVGVSGPAGAGERTTMLEAMRTAAEKRIAESMEDRSRGTFRHAAALVAACAAIDPTPESAAWMTAIREASGPNAALQCRLRRYEEGGN